LPFAGSGDWLGGVVNVADEKKALEQHLVMVGFGNNDPPIRTLLVDELVRYVCVDVKVDVCVDRLCMLCVSAHWISKRSPAYSQVVC